MCWCCIDTVVARSVQGKSLMELCDKRGHVWNETLKEWFFLDNFFQCMTKSLVMISHEINKL